MERLKNLDNYFKEKARKKLTADAQNNPLGIPVMSAEEIKQSCAENHGYETAELNDLDALVSQVEERIEVAVQGQARHIRVRPTAQPACNTKVT